MAMARWSGMQWNVSSSEISYLESLSTGYSINEESDEEELQTISFKTTYRVETGTTDIRGTIDAWHKKLGIVAPIVIGSKVFGPTNMKLQKIDVSDIGLNAKGAMRCATLSFTFKQYEGTKSGTTSSKSESGSKTNPPFVILAKDYSLVKREITTWNEAYGYYMANSGADKGWRIYDADENVVIDSAANVGASSSDKEDKKTVIAQQTGGEITISKKKESFNSETGGYKNGKNR